MSGGSVLSHTKELSCWNYAHKNSHCQRALERIWSCDESVAISLSSFSFCVCMCLSVHVCIDVKHAHDLCLLSPEVNVGCLPLLVLLFILRQGLSVHPKLADLATLTGPWAPKILLSLHLGYKHLSLHLVFFFHIGSGHPNLGLYFQVPDWFLTEALPSPQLFFLLFLHLPKQGDIFLFTDAENLPGTLYSFSLWTSRKSEVEKRWLTSTRDTDKVPTEKNFRHENQRG